MKPRRKRNQTTRPDVHSAVELAITWRGFPGVLRGDQGGWIPVGGRAACGELGQSVGVRGLRELQQRRAVQGKEVVHPVGRIEQTFAVVKECRLLDKRLEIWLRTSRWSWRSSEEEAGEEHD